MCGIVGITNKTLSAGGNLIYGLKKLEYRGYDSAGVIFSDFQMFKTIKTIELLEQMSRHCEDTVGLAHTRWATHGKICLNNAHPIKIGMASVVHNGILENAQELRQKIKYSPKTETDTEILLAVLLYLMKIHGNVMDALTELPKIAHGSYAAAFLFHGQREIFWIKHGLSPLIAAENEHGCMIASDECAVSCESKIHDLPNNSIGSITFEKINIFSNELIKTHEYKPKIEVVKPEKCSFFEQEMQDQIEIAANKSFAKRDFSKYDHIILTGCGSAYIACTFGEKWLNDHGYFAQAKISSEWNCVESAEPKNTLVIVISQSGETADTLSALRKAKLKGFETLAITNKPNSPISSEADEAINMDIGTEHSVASTKSFFTQFLILRQMVDQWRPNAENIQKTLEIDVEKIADEICKANLTLILGKHLLFSAAMEGALKLKELTHINVEAYPSGELKHGYIALVDKQTSVVAMLHEAKDQLYYKTLSNIQEVKSRGGKIFVISHEAHEFADYSIVLPHGDVDETAIMSVIVFQKLALAIAKRKGLNIDRPRNLSKSVTVE